MSTSPLGKQILQADLNLSQKMNSVLTDQQKNMKHIFLGEKLRSNITTQSIDTSVVNGDVGLPEMDKASIMKHIA